jgi:hypothetical protein
MKITSYCPLSFLAIIAVGFISNSKPAIAQNTTDQIIEMMTEIGQEVVSQIEQSPCQNSPSLMVKNNLSEDQNTFKEQIATKFISVFRGLLQEVPSSPAFFCQTSSQMFKKLSECALNSPQY